MKRRGVMWAALDAALESLAATPSECVAWTGRIDRGGYGRFDRRLAHRVVYERSVGPIPDGLQLDHTCHDADLCSLGEECPHHRCVNPLHLEPVTQEINVARGNAWSAINRRKTHCLRGHEFTEANTHIMPSGSRRCRLCVRLHTANYKARRAAESAVAS